MATKDFTMKQKTSTGYDILYPETRAEQVIINPTTGATLATHLDKMMNLSPSILKIPLSEDYRGWQGVAVWNNLIYVVTDRNANFELENIISVYTLDGKLITEKRNAYTGTDPQGKFMSFGDINEIEGYLYVTVYNINAGGNPLISRIIKYDATTLNIVSTHEIGANTAESVTLMHGYYWVVYHDVYVVRKFDLSFKLVQEYELSIETAPQGGFQGSLWEGKFFYANLHGHNTNDSNTPFVELRKYEFDGTTFNFIESIKPPTDGCGQGISKYGEYYFWNDRPNNCIVISKNINHGNVYVEMMPYQNEFSFKPELTNDWEPHDGTYDRPLRVTVLNGVVHLSGIIKYVGENLPILNSLDVAKIPDRFAPKYSAGMFAVTNVGPIRVAIVGQNSTDTIHNAGKMVFQNIMNLEGITWVSFDGISYPLTS